jgi:hypothetical protein
MIEKKLKELYRVDNISSEKSWSNVLDVIKDITEPLLIDFTGANIVDPWDFASFKVILSMDNIHMRFVNKPELVTRIQMMCVIGGNRKERIENIVVEVPKEKTLDEKKVEANGIRLKSSFIIKGDTAVIEVNKTMSQIHNTLTIKNMEYAIKLIHEESGINKFMVVLGNMSVLDSVLDVLAEVIVDGAKTGLDIAVDLDKEESIKKLQLYLYKATNNKYAISDKAVIIRKLMSNNKDIPGFLIKYKRSKATDDFGRHGKGEAISSRVAILREVVGNKVIVETFNGNYFYTKQHWMANNDNEMLDNLHSEIIEINIDEIGLYDNFLGSKYHFVKPIQQRKSESSNIVVDVDESGNVIKRYCNVTERIKEVFEDWEVQHDKELLKQYIEEAKEKLK